MLLSYFYSLLRRQRRSYHSSFSASVFDTLGRAECRFGQNLCVRLTKGWQERDTRFKTSVSGPLLRPAFGRA